MSAFDFSGTGGLGTVSFGGSTAGGTPAGLSFGATTPASSATSGLFPVGSGLFGGSSLFGGGTSTGEGGSTGGLPLFGATPPSAGFSLFGNAGTPSGGGLLLDQSAAAAAAAGGGDGMRGQPQEAIRAYGMCWSKETIACRFNHAFYNVVHPGDVSKYTRPQNVDERSWTQAVQLNPDPHRMVPVFAKGFEDLKKRVDEQDAEVKEHQANLQNANKLINSIYHKHQVGTIVKMEEYKRRNMELASRVLRVMKKIETLRALGIPSIPEEEAFRDKMQALRRELNQPHLFKSMLNEITSLVRMQDEMQDLTYEAIDEENIDKIFQVLQQQQEGLARLTEVITSDLQDLNTITQAGVHHF